MNNGYIAVIDSGIGGLSVLTSLIKIMPNERYLYFGDNFNAPYGNRTDNDLLDITYNNIEYMINRFNVKAVVFGCNTLSVRVLNKIRKYFSVAIFGTFPPIESCIMQKGKTLLLATPATAEKFKSCENFFSVGLKTLAKSIEDEKFNLNMIDIEKELNNSVCDFPINIIYKEKFDRVILGCTHYFFVKNKIIDHFDHTFLTDGNHFTAKTVFNYLKNVKSLGFTKGNRLLFIGRNKLDNSIFFSRVVRNILNL